MIVKSFFSICLLPFNRFTRAGISSRGNVIVNREAPATSSSESIFTDPESETNEGEKETSFNLTITKLEQLDLISDRPQLQIVRYETINFDGATSDDEMPIVKSSSEQENGTDKGIFSVSRVKKVELSELPLTTDICTRKYPESVRDGKFLAHSKRVGNYSIPRPSCSANDLIKFSLIYAAPSSEQQTVTPTNVSGSGNNNNVIKSSNGSGNSVLHRVITLTTANHDSNHAGKAKPPPPAYVPEKLHFSAYEKFEGENRLLYLRQASVIKERKLIDKRFARALPLNH